MKYLILVILAVLIIGCESNSVDSTKIQTQTQITEKSDQPLCCKLEVLENGRLIQYWFSCYSMIIQETQESKFLTFLYKDGSVAHSFDINNIMNGSNVYYAPDCD